MYGLLRTIMIGIFDSGIGGLSVLRLASLAMPDTHFIYYADSDNVPYGEQSEENIFGFVENAVNFLIEHGTDAIVLACNTATSVAASKLREKLSVPIIGMEPAVKKALDESENGRILVVATPLTVRGDKLRHLIGRVDENHLVDLHPLPGLVRLAENERFDGFEADQYLKNELSRFDLTKYSALVLGCTHFTYFSDSFKRILPSSVRLVDGGEGTVRHLMHITESIKAEPCSPKTEFFESGRPVTNENLHRMERFIARLNELDK